MQKILKCFFNNFGIGIFNTTKKNIFYDFLISNVCLHCNQNLLKALLNILSYLIIWIFYSFFDDWNVCFYIFEVLECFSWLFSVYVCCEMLSLALNQYFHKKNCWETYLSKFRSKIEKGYTLIECWCILELWRVNGLIFHFSWIQSLHKAILIGMFWFFGHTFLEPCLYDLL